jgi:GNAT superfamily N-acetyltransferase
MLGVMSPAFDITPARSADDLSAVAALFQRYAQSLPIDLGYQGFDAELAALPGRYAPPEGELFLARGSAGEALGCVGLRPIAPGCAEIKRLFLTPEARGQGLGKALAQVAVRAARCLGYGELKLDTLESMQAAIALYEGMGFVRTPPYYAPTPPGTVFMALKL